LNRLIIEEIILNNNYLELEKIFRFFEIYINRRKVKRFLYRMEKLPDIINKAGLPDHDKVKLEKTLKLLMLQLFKPKSKQEQREFLKS
jgi:hypothetical protein